MNLLKQDLAECMGGRLTEPKLSLYTPLLGAAMTERQIEGEWRAGAFLAQLRHESICLTTWEEIGGRKRLKSDGTNYYGGFWGRGPIQLTWREAYRDCGRALMLDLEHQPELVLHPEVGFRAAAWYWHSRGLNAIADRIQTEGLAAFDTISKKIHGCGNMTSCPCWGDRRDAYAVCYRVMSTPRVIV